MPRSTRCATASFGSSRPSRPNAGPVRPLDAYDLDVDVDRLEQVRAALIDDRTVDIVTVGARTRIARTTEIWFTNIDGVIYICGTPSADGSPGASAGRDWLANLKANPDFHFKLKESVQATLTAQAELVTDRAERARLYATPQTSWYRLQAGSIERLVEDAPLVRVVFTNEAVALNPAQG